MMETSRDVVITGVGVASPIGIGTDPFWHALLAGESGIRPIDLFDSSGLSVRFGGQIAGFDPKLYVRPRKSLKVMSREIQLGFAAADLAMADAGLANDRLQPERFGVVFGNDMIYADLDDLESTYRRARREDGSFAYDQWSEAIHEELHGRDAGDLIGLRHGGEGFCVDLDEGPTTSCVARQFLKHRPKRLAGPAPRSPEIN